MPLAAPGGDPGDSAGGHWFEPLADHMGPAYLRYSFTRGTANEVSFLVEVLGLAPGDRVLDLGCGPGRHAAALAERGIVVTGVDVSRSFVELARRTVPHATFFHGDARELRFDGEFDAVVSLCQGGFGLNRTVTGSDPSVPEPGPDPDLEVLGGIRRALVPGGRVAVSAFSAYFQVRYLEATDDFDASRGVNRERTEVRDPDGAPLAADLWTTCFTPRELRQLAREAGLTVEHVWSVTPGDYAVRPPDLDHPEYLLIARRAA